MSRKVAAGAQFVITQLGYDARKFHELIGIQRHMSIPVPTLGSVYLLTPHAARIMNRGRVPGAVVTAPLLDTVEREWQDRRQGKTAAIERAARLGSVMQGLGYRGIHIGGIHRDFATVGMILDRMEKIKDDWRGFPSPDSIIRSQTAFMPFVRNHPMPVTGPRFGLHPRPMPLVDRVLYPLMQRSHNLFFNFESPAAPLFQMVSKRLDNGMAGRLFMHLAEHPIKRMLLGCLRCGDCAIQHVGFLCPESGCPKHTPQRCLRRQSRNGMCEVHPDRRCVWFRAHNRLAARGKIKEMCDGCVPPRMWELNNTSSWLNFHLRKGPPEQRQ